MKDSFISMALLGALAFIGLMMMGNEGEQTKQISDLKDRVVQLEKEQAYLSAPKKD